MALTAAGIISYTLGIPTMQQQRDPRIYQIATLVALVAYGASGLDLEIEAAVAAAIVATALATQFLCTKLFSLPRFDPRSALISALSLCLLLRAGSMSLVVATTAVVIASKFFLRVDGRHVFNPTNFGLVAVMASVGGIWVSPGQWGTGAFFAFLLAGIGGLVIHRASRSDVTYAFVGFYAALVLGRTLWLGDPLAIPLHHLQNGAFLLFAFFMISDPKTTPDSRAGRILFALMVALGAGFVHFVLFEPNGFLWSLVLSAPTTPLINRMLPGERYQWRRPAMRLSQRSYA